MSKPRVGHKEVTGIYLREALHELAVRRATSKGVSLAKYLADILAISLEAASTGTATSATSSPPVAPALTEAPRRLSPTPVASKAEQRRNEMMEERLRKGTLK